MLRGDGAAHCIVVKIQKLCRLYGVAARNSLYTGSNSILERRRQDTPSGEEQQMLKIVPLLIPGLIVCWVGLQGRNQRSHVSTG